MPSTSAALSPASRIALRMASTAMARVVRPDAREYSVSPTPTMQYLSRSPRLWTSIFRLPPVSMSTPRPAGPQPRNGPRRARRSILGRDPVAARCYHFAADPVMAGSQGSRGRLPVGIGVRLFVQAGMQVGHHVERAADAPVQLGKLSPRAVDLTAEPLVFQLERLRLALQPLVRLPQLGRFVLQAIVFVERTVDRCHPALHRFDPPARLAH